MRGRAIQLESTGFVEVDDEFLKKQPTRAFVRCAESVHPGKDVRSVWVSKHYAVYRGLHDLAARGESHGLDSDSAIAGVIRAGSLRITARPTSESTLRASAGILPCGRNCPRLRHSRHEAIRRQQLRML